MGERDGRAVAVRTIDPTSAGEIDAVYVCAGDNPVFVANVIVLAHNHNIQVATRSERGWYEGL